MEIQLSDVTIVKINVCTIRWFRSMASINNQLCHVVSMTNQETHIIHLFNDMQALEKAYGRNSAALVNVVVESQE